MQEKLLLRRAEAAAVLSISPRVLWSLTNRKQIPIIRLGRSVRYRLDDLRAWLEGQAVVYGTMPGYPRKKKAAVEQIAKL